MEAPQERREVGTIKHPWVVDVVLEPFSNGFPANVFLAKAPCPFCLNHTFKIRIGIVWPSAFRWGAVHFYAYVRMLNRTGPRDTPAAFFFVQRACQSFRYMPVSFNRSVESFLLHLRWTHLMCSGFEEMPLANCQGCTDCIVCTCTYLVAGKKSPLKFRHAHLCSRSAMLCGRSSLKHDAGCLGIAVKPAS